MPLLAELTGTCRCDLIPGYTLSPLRLIDIGQIEAEAEAAYVADTQASLAGIAEAAAGPIRQAARKYIADGNLLLGMPDFDRLLLGNELVGMMVHLALRHRHRKISRRRACQLLQGGDQQAVKRFLLASLGFDFDRRNDSDDEDQQAPPAKRARKPVDWPGLFAALSRRGVNAIEAAQMTFRQLSATLNLTGSSANGADRLLRQMAKAKRRQHEILDVLCAAESITPAQLAEMSATDAAELVGKHAGQAVDPNGLAEILAEYSRAKRNATATAIPV